MSHLIQDLCCLQIQLFLSLVLKGLKERICLAIHVYDRAIAKKKLYRHLSSSSLEMSLNQISYPEKIRGNRDNLQIILHFTP